MKISLFRGGYQTTQTDETIEDWDEFVDLVTTPEIGQKNGDYFIRGFCDGARSDGNMQSVDLIIIDGDQTLDNGSSCVPLVTAHNVIKENGYTHVIYNSFSNDLTNNIHKWRLVIPCPDITDKQDLAQGVEEVITLLHERGVMVRNVVENNTTSQPWFLPRCNEACFEDFDYRYYDKNEYRLTGFTRPSAIFNAVESGKSLDEGQGIFSWDYVTSQFKEGTLHMGLKSACGWLILTTDWADSQIKQHLCALVEAICPDRDKVDRACNKGEIDSLIKYCRGKSGTSITAVANWKDHLISADELKGKVFPPVKWAVDGVIPEGLTVLAGDPKAGKSLMAVDICNAIASGGEAFGKQACVQGDVVYISLEDPQRRVQDRIKQQCDLWPGAFHLVDGGIPQLGVEFYKIIDEMVMLWPETRAIIIDTMQFIIPQKANGVSDYDHYYKQLDPLHKWALENHIAVITITHKSKAKAQTGDNPFAGIIGSVAIQGTADAMILLSRNHAKTDSNDIEKADGFLDITGRELENNKFSLDFDAECMKWALRGEFSADEATGNMNWLVITEVLKTKQMTPKEVAVETNLNGATVRSSLSRMKEKNIVCKAGSKYGVVGQDYKENDGW